jgi:hypothetical protein
VSRIVDAVEAGDLDELLRIVDGLADAREWDGLIEVRDRSRRALERGRQLWPAASYAEYRLALDAPPPYAALVLVEDAGRFALGPLYEVAASTHTWTDLAPHVQPGAVPSLAAHERALRGETIDADSVPHADVLTVPLHLARFESEYAVASYRPERGEFPAPELPRGRPLELPMSARSVAPGDVETMFRDVVSAWTAGSEGRARVAAVEGDINAAIAALGITEARGAWLAVGEALALLAWAAASGGRHGRRRGSAVGRDIAWATAAVIAGFAVEEPPTEDSLAGAISELQWCAWSAPDVTTGWILRLAVADPEDGLAWAIDAQDPAGPNPAPKQMPPALASGGSTGDRAGGEPSAVPPSGNAARRRDE